MSYTANRFVNVSFVRATTKIFAVNVCTSIHLTHLAHLALLAHLAHLPCKPAICVCAHY
jgi:hypothetical protein